MLPSASRPLLPRCSARYRACFHTHRHDGLRACAWPLLKAMLGSPRDGEEGTGFFSFTHEEDGLTPVSYTHLTLPTIE